MAGRALRKINLVFCRTPPLNQASKVAHGSFATEPFSARADSMSAVTPKRKTALQRVSPKSDQMS